MKAFVVKKEILHKLIDKYDEAILIYNPDMVLNKNQALFAAKLALIAFQNGQNIAKKMPIEFLIRLSGEKQISKALSFGMDGLKEMAGVVIIGDNVSEDITNIDFTPNVDIISRKYGVSVEGIEKKILEKMSLVDI